MERKNLKVFTRISFFTALGVIIVIPTYAFMTLIFSNENAEFITKVFSLLASLTMFASVSGIPLSIVSMFSKENLAIRLFTLIINLLPSSILGYVILMEFIDEFLRGPP